MPERFLSPAPPAPRENPFLPDLKRVEVTPVQKRAADEERTEERLLAMLGSSSREDIEAEAKRLGVSREDLREVVKSEFGKLLAEGHIYLADRIAKQWGLKPMEKKPHIFDAVVSRLESGDPYTASEIAQGVLSQNDLQSESIRHAASGGAIRALERGSFSAACELQQGFGIKKDIFSTKAARQAMEVGLIHALLQTEEDRDEDSQYGDAYVTDEPQKALEISGELGLIEKEQLEIAQRAALQILERPKRSTIKDFLRVYRSAPFPNEFFLRKEVIEGLQDLFAYELASLTPSSLLFDASALRDFVTNWKELPLPKSFFRSHPAQHAAMTLLRNVFQESGNASAFPPLFDLVQVDNEVVVRAISLDEESRARREEGDAQPGYRMSGYELRLLYHFPVPFEKIPHYLRRQVEESLVREPLHQVNEFLKNSEAPTEDVQTVIQRWVDATDQRVPGLEDLMALIDCTRRLKLPNKFFQRFTDGDLMRDGAGILAGWQTPETIEAVGEVMDFFGIGKQDQTKVALRAIELQLRNGDFDDRIQDHFSVPKEAVNKLIYDAALELISSSYEPSRGIDLLKLLGDYKTLLKKEEVREAAEKGLKRVLLNGSGANIEEFLQKFPFQKETIVSAVRSVAEAYLKEGRPEKAFAVNHVCGRVDETLNLMEGEFNAFTTWEVYALMNALRSNTDLTDEQQEELTILGVSSRGMEAVREVMKALSSFRQSLFTSEGMEAARIVSSQVLRAYTKALVRFDVGQWGSHEDAAFQDTVKTYQEKKETLRPLPAELAPSEVIQITKIDSGEQEAYQPTEDAKTRLLTFAESIKKALQLRGNVEELHKLFVGMRDKRDALIASLKEKLVGQENEKAKAALERRIQDLHAVDFDQLTAPQKMFSVLASHGDVFAQDLRALVFWASLNMRPEQEGEAHQKIETIKQGSHPVDAFSWAVDFIDHITNKEVMRQYFTDKQAAEAFKKLLNVKALEEELVRAQSQGTKGTAPFKFVPQRNLLMEFSGHIADACWASKYDSILEQFPNFSSMLIVSNPEDPKTMRLAGAAMLIETQAEDKTKLLVIRGLNPQQNVINNLQPKDFVDKIFAYLKPLAKKMGRKVAIVIDGHSGGSGTNRPVLFAHLTERKARMKPIKLASSEDTYFNGYDIRNVTYLAD